MDKILIVGSETVVGANLAATLCDQFQVVALSVSNSVEIQGCQNSTCIRQDRTTTHDWIASERPDSVILCPGSATSCWDDGASSACDRRTISQVQNWSNACAEFGSRLILISSDAVFTGPWMFHDEDSQRLCPSTQAQTIRTIEQNILENDVTALVIRTNAFGWKPRSLGIGWIEQLIETLEADGHAGFDPVRHATPILATDLADFVAAALEQDVAGILHIAGAERVNPAQFAIRLALRFGLPVPRAAARGALFEPATGFGQGETSLQCSTARQSLGMPMPMLDEGIDRLFDQRDGDFIERLDATPATVHDKVA